MEQSNYVLDNRDKKILSILQKTATISNAELAEKVGLSPSPCLRRVKRLEQEGFITAYRAEVNRKKLGYPVMAFVSLTLSRQTEEDLEFIETQLKELPEVINCYLMTGTSDYLLQVLAKSLDDYNAFIRQYITKLPSIQHIHTSFALKNISENTIIPSS